MKSTKSRSAAERKAIKTMKQSLVILVLLMVAFVMAIFVYAKLNPTEAEKTAEEELMEGLLENLGVDKDSTTGKIVTDSGLVIEGNVAKTVKQYRTLAEAEEDMGYYLGLHNKLECCDSYELVGMYNIGDGAWYQALYEDTRADADIAEKQANGEEITTEYMDSLGAMYPSITIKTAKDGDVNGLIAPYGDNFMLTENVTIYEVPVTVKSADGYTINLVYFSVPNGKVYSMYTTYGIPWEVFGEIAVELIGNLQIMEDWVD